MRTRIVVLSAKPVGVKGVLIRDELLSKVTTSVIATEKTWGMCFALFTAGYTVVQNWSSVVVLILIS